MVAEFDLINKYFAPLAAEGAADLQDDAATFSLPEGRDCVVTKDMLVAGVHFFQDDNPADIAFKAVAVNVSDLVAKGAHPVGYCLGLGLSGDEDDSWLAAFAGGLKAAADAFQIELYGGDTVKCPGQLTLSVTAFGDLAANMIVRRSGAKVGDLIYVTGCIGSAALGLLARQGKIAPHRSFEQSYARPQPKLEVISLIRDFAGASADVSDGLVADAAHIAQASGVGAYIHGNLVPVTAAARAAVRDKPDLLETVLTGGDDYEVVFTVAPHSAVEMEACAASLDLSVSHIGEITSDQRIFVADQDGNEISLANTGFCHF